MEHIRGLRCINCNKLHAISIIYECEQCFGSLNVEYEESVYSKTELFNQSNKQGIWRYRSLLPVNANNNPVTLGEGNTPLLDSEEISKCIGIQNVYLKMETGNPTLSFKDRSISVAFTLAKQFNVEKVVTASTGNTGVSVAAYAARAGLNCEVFVPEHTPREKINMIEIYGATINIVQGTFSDAYNYASQIAAENNWFNVTSTFLNPFSIEGNKTIAYEIYEQLDKKAPEWIIIPIGAGPLLVACYKGFEELYLMGLIKKLPKMVGVQAENCSPIVQAFNQGKKSVMPWKGSDKTIASGIADPLTTYANDGTRTLNIIKESNGSAIAVSEDNIIRNHKYMSREAGIFSEPSSALVFGALDALKEKVQQDDKVVCVITGHGLKSLDVIN